VRKQNKSRRSEVPAYGPIVADGNSNHQTVTRGRLTKGPLGSFPYLDNSHAGRKPRRPQLLTDWRSVALPESGVKLTLSSRGGARHVLNVLQVTLSRRRKQPYGGSDFFNSTFISEVSATTSGVMLQAAIANNINMIARVKALTLAAR
jgi:hypothetical protein